MLDLQLVIAIFLVFVNASSGEIDGDLLIARFLLRLHLRLKFVEFRSLLFAEPFIVAVEVVGGIVDHLCSLSTRMNSSQVSVTTRSRESPRSIVFDQLVLEGDCLSDVIQGDLGRLLCWTGRVVYFTVSCGSRE